MIFGNKTTSLVTRSEAKNGHKMAGLNTCVIQFVISIRARVFRPFSLKLRNFKGLRNLVHADLCLDFLKRTKLLSLFKIEITSFSFTDELAQCIIRMPKN